MCANEQQPTNSIVINCPALPIEARVAAKWWADVLRKGDPLVDSGDRKLDGTTLGLLAAFGKPKRLNTEQIDVFELALAHIVNESYIKTESWKKARANPMWGSATRTLAVDYGPCNKLRAAYQFAGGSLHPVDVFPIKTVMWINPGEVTLRHGYSAPEVTLPLVEAQQ